MKGSVIMDHAQHRFRSRFIVCLFLVVITLIAYWQLPSNDFLSFDDNEYITQNANTRQGITLKNIVWAFSVVDFAYWHPITWISHMLFFQLFGLNPSMHHLMSLFLHIANVLLIFIVLKRMTGALWQSAFVAFMVALHPLNVESVSWASELKNVLSTFFWMSTMFSYLYYAERPSFLRYILTILFFTLGLMAKPMLATLPFALLLLDHWPLNRFGFYPPPGFDHGSSQSAPTETKHSRVFRLILEKIPFFFLSAVCIGISTLSVQRPEVVISAAAVPIRLRIANALISYVTYIKKMVLPHDLAVFYPFPKAIPLWEAAGAGLFLSCITILAFRWVKAKPYFIVGWLWYIGTLIPVIGLVQAGLWPSTADRFAYIPLIGLFILISWSVPALMFQWRYKKVFLGITSIAILLNFTATTHSQNKYWANSIVLFQRAIDVTEDNGVAHQKLGEALSAKGKTLEAIKHYKEALRITPTLIGAHLNLGVLLREEGKFDEAVKHFITVIRLRPDSLEAHVQIGVAMEEQNNLEAAVGYYLKALRIDPHSAIVHNNLGTILARKNNVEGAIYHLHEALRIDPDYAPAYFNLGKIDVNQRHIEKAIFNFKEALKLNPHMAQALYNLSWILATHEDDKYRNGEEAVRLASELCKITKYQQPLALDALAAAYAETGEFDTAVFTAQKGLKLIVQKVTEEPAFGLNKRLALYKEKRPYRQSFH